MRAPTSTSVAAGRISPKTSPWTAVTSSQRDVGHEHPGAHDVRQGEAGLGQRALDDRERGPGLGGGVARVARPAVGPASVVPATQHESPTTIARL